MFDCWRNLCRKITMECLFVPRVDIISGQTHSAAVVVITNSSRDIVVLLLFAPYIQYSRLEVVNWFFSSRNEGKLLLCYLFSCFILFYLFFHAQGKVSFLQQLIGQIYSAHARWMSNLKHMKIHFEYRENWFKKKNIYCIWQIQRTNVFQERTKKMVSIYAGGERESQYVSERQ